MAPFNKTNTDKPAKRLHIGTSGWAYKDWKGNFYPDGIKSTQYLTHYARHFDTVEVDSTFYGTPKRTTVERWAAQTPESFIFTLKVPQIITHEKRLQDCEMEWQQFLETASVLGSKLGPLILQFDYKFRYDLHFPLLKSFLQKYGGTHRLAVEIRNKDWHRNEFYNLLESFGVALVLNDLYYMPRVIHLTADFTIVRLLGNRKLVPGSFTQVLIERQKDLDWWSERIRQFLDKNLEVYVYSNNHYQGFAPATVTNLLQRLS